jgi:hypothetical protein
MGSFAFQAYSAGARVGSESGKPRSTAGFSRGR